MEQTARRIGIWVFSGTGNTQKCANALQDALTEQGVSADLHRIEDGSETAQERELVICYISRFARCDMFASRQT